MEFSMNYFVTSDQTTLAYFDKGEGQPIILLAGYGQGVKSWFHQAEALLAHGGLRVIGLDRRQHGASQHVLHGQHIARHGEDLHNLLELLKLEEVIMIGHSQGASVIYAYMMLHGCDRVRAVLSVDQTPKMINDSSWKYGMYDVKLNTVADVLKQQLPKATVREMDIVLKQKLMQYAEQDHVFRLKDTAPLLQNHLFEDWRDVLERASCPMLFVGCKQSPYWSYEHAEQSAKLAKLGHAYIFEESGHVPQLECPVEFNQMMMAFVDQYAE